jgi:adenylate kinase family enzyme
LPEAVVFCIDVAPVPFLPAGMYAGWVGTPEGDAMTRRIVIKGTSGIGKTTFGAELAHRLGVPFIELDALHHGPNWAEPSAEAFRAQVRAAMDAASDGWVIDGNYDSKLGGTVVGQADTIVWLDLPLWIMYPRLWRRTMYRVTQRVELWNGNRETWRDQFASRETLFFWAAQRLYRYRRRWPAMFAGDRRLVRLRSVKEARRWLEGQGDQDHTAHASREARWQDDSTEPAHPVQH